MKDLEAMIPLIRRLLIGTLLSLSWNTYAAKIYVTDYASEAQAKVYVTTYQSEANCIVYETKYQSDTGSGVWYFTNYKSIKLF